MTPAALSSDALRSPPGTPAESVTDVATAAGLDPLVRRCLDPADGLAAAECCTRELANGHYENFSVVSLLLPRHLRQDFCNIYAFCRLADDLGDELGSRRESTAELAKLRTLTQQAYAGRVDTHLFVALAHTAKRHSIPIQPFLDLIDAFEQDQRVTRYESFEQLTDYCRRSADPVGRLVLHLCGYADEARQRLSDSTCTALQLVNFWQDVRRDLVDRDRIYIPEKSMRRFDVTESCLRRMIRDGRCEPAYRDLIRCEMERTLAMFTEGRRLLPLLRPAVRGQVALFGAGGLAIADAIRRRNYDTITVRPSLSKLQKGRLVCTGLASMAVQTARGGFASMFGRKMAGMTDGKAHGGLSE